MSAMVVVEVTEFISKIPCKYDVFQYIHDEMW